MACSAPSGSTVAIAAQRGVGADRAQEVAAHAVVREQRLHQAGLDEAFDVFVGARPRVLAGRMVAPQAQRITSGRSAS